MIALSLSIAGMIKEKIEAESMIPEAKPKIISLSFSGIFWSFLNKKMTAEPRMVPKKVMRRPMIVIAIGLIEKTSCTIIAKYREYGFSEH